MPCRLNRRRLWATRLMLETFQHEASYFVTLTYSEEVYSNGGCVSVREAQLFLKRLRKANEKVRLRYYVVGEYGERTGRPHFHLALFGLRDGCSSVAEAWGKGHVHVGLITPESAGYLVGYVTKSCTRGGDARLKGRCPEFARMSLKPGIGAGAAQVLADAAGEELPSVIRMKGKLFPIGRYVQRKITEVYGQARSLKDWQLKYLESAERWFPDVAEICRQERHQSGLVASQRVNQSSLRREL